MYKNIISKIARRCWGPLKSIPGLIYSYIRGDLLGQIFPIKPVTLNFLANDICNSRCQMCLIWEKKKIKELTPEELTKILNDKLFTRLKYVGISGGEPTLRKDLPALVDVICRKKPKVKGVGIITNGILEKSVKDRIFESYVICQKHRISFNIMISLDGVGDVHDIVRGRKGNFESSFSLLQHFQKEKEISLSFGCTITKSNAPYVDELLDFALQQGFYGRFRIAEFIDRLYNSNQKEFIRSFSDLEKYHLGLFFFRLEHEFEKSPKFRKTYRNIRGMIAEGKPRANKCPYQTDAVVLTSAGELLYCSPKSPSLGNVLKNSAKKLYFSNIPLRKDIIKNECGTCIHDYHVDVTLPERLSQLKNKIKIFLHYNCRRLLIGAALKHKQKIRITDLSSLTSRKILIVGWYGTETVGDKAILWAIVNDLLSRSIPPQQIYLSSLYPFISRWTIREMNLTTLTIVETYSKEFEKICSEADEIIVGGGPLMDIEPLNHILFAFMNAASHKAITRIAGCGIGPLKSPLYVKVVKEILRLTDHIVLRDIASSKRCQNEFLINEVSISPDPATNYVLALKAQVNLLKNAIPPLGKGTNVSCFIRELTTEYTGKMDYEDFLAEKNEFEKQLAALISYIAIKMEVSIHLLPMHTFSVGGDDRIINRRIAQYIDLPSDQLDKEKKQVIFARLPVSPREILESMYHSKFNICMRFHSVVFAENLEVPYIAIDYTRGGKIQAFLMERGEGDRMLTFDDVVKGQWKSKVDHILKKAIVF